MFHRTTPRDVVAGIRRRIFDPGPRNRIAITEDELFDILADSRRRTIIDRLADVNRGETVSRSGLAREIAADETHMPPERVPEERIEPVDVELSRTHLPMLDDAGVIRWNASDDEVAPGHAIGPIVEWLRAMERHVEPFPARRRVGRIGRIDSIDASWELSDDR